MSSPIDVGVFDSNEVYRRGLISCLVEDTSFRLVVSGALPDPDAPVSVAIISPEVISRVSPIWALVVCQSPGDVLPPGPWLEQVHATLPRGTVTAVQLTSAVRAASAGLRILPPRSAHPEPLDHRQLKVLRLLSDGATTAEISSSLGYSIRTVKGIIQGIERDLASRSRAHAVAEALRRQII